MKLRNFLPLLAALLFQPLHAANVNIQADDTTGVLWRPSAFEKFIVPSQTGHSGKYLTTNGTVTSWATVSGGGGGGTWGSITGTLTDQTDLNTALGLKLATSTLNGYFADPSTNGSFSASAWRTDLALVIGANVQAYDADLDYLAGFTPAANVKSILNAANYAAIRGLLDLEPGTDFLAYPTGTPTGSKFLRDDNTWQSISGGGNMLGSNNLSDLTDVATARTNLGGTTAGKAIFTVTNPSAVTWLRINADNTVTSRSASETRTDLSLAPGSDVQAYDADLSSWGAITRASGFDTFAATPSSANLLALLTTKTGTGSAVFGTDPLLLSPNAAMGALAVDVTKKRNTKSISADSTLTFSATPTTGFTFGLVLTNSDSAAHTITIPSSYSQTILGTRTTFTIPASSTVELSWTYDGTTYSLVGEPYTINDLTAATAATGDSVPGYDTSAGADKKFLISEVLALGIDDTAYDATSWNGDTTKAPSKNAIRDKIAALAQADIGGLTTADSPQFTGVNVGNASDTTVTRASAGDIAVEGNRVYRVGGSFAGQPDVWVIPIGDETTAITTGTAKVTFRAPYAATVTAVRASLTTDSSSGTPTFDINEGGTTILSTKLTVDATEKTSTTAAAAAVISDTALTDDAEITIDVDTAGTGAAGAKISIYVTR